MPAARRRPTLSAVLRDYPPSLAKALRADCIRDDASTAALWAGYFESRSTALEQQLVTHYMPDVAMMVQATVRGRPGGFSDPLEDYLSDGMFGLLRFIRRNRNFKLRLTGWQVRKAIVKAVWTETRMRSWAGKSRTERGRTIELIRAALVHETGKVPTAAQIRERVASTIANPGVYFSFIDEGLRAMVPRSQAKEQDENQISRQTDPATIDPSQAVLNDELRALMLKGLKGRDRQIFVLLLKGKSAVDIARDFDIHANTVNQRLNGILWEARCRADLAACADAEPDAAPPVRDKWNHYPGFELVKRLKAVG